MQHGNYSIFIIIIFGVIGFTIAMTFLTMLALISTRLLGIRQAWWRLLLVAFLGSSVGAGFAEALGAQRLGNPGAELVYFSSILVAMMLFTMAFELVLARPFVARGARGRGAGVPHPIRAVRRRLARWSRYLQITSIVARYGLAPYLTGRRHPVSADQPGGKGQHKGLWGRAREALEEAGGAFVKLGQVLSTRPDLLPPEAIAQLSGLQDQVPPAAPGAVEALLAEELKAPPAEVFASFEAEPLAAASIAQAYRAQLASGEQVVMKVQRPGIREPIERDLDILLNMARTIEQRAAWARAFGVVDLAEGFAAALREELDFRIEARNITAVATALGTLDSRAHAPVYVPRVFPELSTSRVLVIEWLDGVSVRDADALVEELQLDRCTLARDLLRCFLRQLLGQGTFHADPHPGNIMLLRDGRLALLDFGSVGRLDPLQQSALQRLLIALDRRNAAMLSSALLDLAQEHTGIDELRLERALAQLMAQRLGPGMPVGPEVFRDLFALLLNFGLSFAPVVGGVFRALVTLQGTLLLLDPHFQLLDEARGLGEEWMREMVAPTSLRKAVTEEALNLLPLLQRFPRRVDRISAALEQGTLSVNVRLLADERDVRIITRLVSYVVMAFLGAALGIMGALFLGMSGGPALTSTMSIYQVFGYTGLFLSAVLILRVFIALVREKVG
ncbi:MAG TPA: AarF/UbiB family protein [Ktedonobacterales bacterium]|nr:AarF/UbiB family protein [Ktedonobacterales bacterium]